MAAQNSSAFTVTTPTDREILMVQPSGPNIQWGTCWGSVQASLRQAIALASDQQRASRHVQLDATRAAQRARLEAQRAVEQQRMQLDKARLMMLRRMEMD